MPSFLRELGGSVKSPGTAVLVRVISYGRELRIKIPIKLGALSPLTRTALESYIVRAAMGKAAERSSRARALTIAGIVWLLTASIIPTPPPQTYDPSLFRPGPDEVAQPAGLPEIGLWMVGPDLSYAHWMGQRFEGKRLREPINIIVSDASAGDEAEAVRRFLFFCGKAGFKSRPGHSSGYFGWLGGRLYPQLPTEKHHCLADGPFEWNNNHGRFFGPVKRGYAFIFIGALSREKISLLVRAKHGYVSFNRARDAFVDALVRRSGFTVRDDVLLKNAILADTATGTGDHDGVAVWLAAPERM